MTATDSKSPTVATVLNRTSIAPGETLELALVIDLSATTNGDTARPPLSVVFVLDTSGSMRGEPIEQVKASVAQLIDLLGARDEVGVVGFSNLPVVVSPRAPLTAVHRAQLRRRLGALRACGGTGMTRGLQCGAETLGVRQENQRQVMVLLSDGAPTDGATPLTLSALVAGFRHDISMTTLGYGPRHHAELLDAVAKAGGGDYWFIADPQEAQLEFARAVGAQGDVLFDGVDVILQTQTGCEVVTVIGAPSRLGPDGLVVPQADLRPDQVRTTIVVLRVTAGAALGPMPLLTVKTRARASGALVSETAAHAVAVVVAEVPSEVDRAVTIRVALARAEERRVESRALGDRGQFAQAADLLVACIDELEVIGGQRSSEGSEIAEAIGQLKDEVRAYRSGLSSERYAAFKSESLGVELTHGSRSKSSSRSSRWAHDLKSAVLDSDVVAHLGVRRDGLALFAAPLSGEVTIGRSSDNDIVLRDDAVGRHHARVVCRGGEIFFVAMASAPVDVNGVRLVDRSCRLAPRDVVNIGPFELELTAVN